MAKNPCWQEAEHLGMDELGATEKQLQLVIRK